MYWTTRSQWPSSKRGWYPFATFPLDKDIMHKGPFKIHQQGKFIITLSFKSKCINQLIILSENGLFFAGYAVREPARITWLGIALKLIIHTLYISEKRTMHHHNHIDLTGRKI
jgi:hypothetical protein